MARGSAFVCIHHLSTKQRGDNSMGLHKIFPEDPVSRLYGPIKIKPPELIPALREGTCTRPLTTMPSPIIKASSQATECGDNWHMSMMRFTFPQWMLCACRQLLKNPTKFHWSQMKLWSLTVKTVAQWNRSLYNKTYSEKSDSIPWLMRMRREYCRVNMWRVPADFKPKIFESCHPKTTSRTVNM